MIMIGISTQAFLNETLSAALEEIEKRAAYAEIFSEGNHDVIHCRKNDILSSYALFYSIHAPTMDINPASVREKIRAAGIEVLKNSAEFCMNHEIEILVVHPGYAADFENMKQAEKSLSKSLAELSEIAEETGVRICIENMPNVKMFLFKNPEDVDFSKYQNLEFILDVGHAHTTENLNEFLKNPIAHYHIHDNFGDIDNHLGFGSGSVGDEMLKRIIEKAKAEKAVLIAENKTIEDAEMTVNALKKAGAI